MHETFVLYSYARLVETNCFGPEIGAPSACNRTGWFPKNLLNHGLSLIVDGKKLRSSDRIQNVPFHKL